MRSCSLWIYAQPKASKTQLVGWHGDAIKIRIAAPPVEGAANQELIRFLSKEIGVPRNAVAITSGTTAKRKRVRVEGMAESDVLGALGL